MRAKKQVQTVLYVAVCKIEGRLGLLTFGYSLKGLSDRFQPEEDTGGFGRVDEAEEGPDHDLWLAEGDIVTICQIPTFAPGEYVDRITVHVCADCKAVFVPNKGDTCKECQEEASPERRVKRLTDALREFGFKGAKLGAVTKRVQELLPILR
jgi:hypothetical protein